MLKRPEYEGIRSECKGCGNSWPHHEIDDTGYCPICDTPDAEVEKVFKEFWHDIVCDDNGELILNQVKKELADFKIVMDNASEVYCTLTESRISKPNTLASAVIGVVRDLEEKSGREYLEDEIDALKAKGVHVDRDSSFSSLGERRTLSNKGVTGTWVFIPDDGTGGE